MEIKALTRQGFVSSERRASGTIVFKLRYRLNGRQRVRYLGTDPIASSTVAQTLADLQREGQLHDQVRAACAQAAQVLRQTTRQLAPLIAPLGFKFHGRAIRRSRQSRSQ